ncbi:MAG: LacI family DNA-binding transcriptional regulator, partial [Mesotoga sp.]|nr:LacI family DNA-binding transcriptional regulator [Mesotoga sp.]
MKKPTIKDVASLSGVGTGTVSRVLNGGSVKATTRIKVIQ